VIVLHCPLHSVLSRFVCAIVLFVQEPKEVTLTLTNNHALWAKQSVNRYKEVLLFVCLLCLG
jgi:hypothetical protein